MRGQLLKEAYAQLIPKDNPVQYFPQVNSYRLGVRKTSKKQQKIKIVILSAYTSLGQLTILEPSVLANSVHFAGEWIPTVLDSGLVVDPREESKSDMEWNFFNSDEEIVQRFGVDFDKTMDRMASSRAKVGDGLIPDLDALSRAIAAIKD